MVYFLPNLYLFSVVLTFLPLPIHSTYTCDSSCTTCKSAAKNGCLSCPTGYYIQSGQCLSQTAQSCSAGYYYDTSTSACQLCYTTCNTCDGGLSTNCLTCKGTYMLYQGTCISNCPIGTYISSGSCIACDSSCATCNGPNSTNCITCPNSNEYIDPNDNSCKLCNSNCLTCSNTAMNCLSCYSNYVISSYNEIGKCCLINEYQDSNHICQTCDSSCMSCNTISTNCSSCYNNLQLLTINNLGQCICPTDLYNNSNVCQSCDSTCKTCYLTGTNCLSCFNNLQIQIINNNGQCICPSGQYNNSNNCQNCDLTCYTCDITAKNCISCYNDLQLLQTVNNIGYCSCPHGKYNNSNNCLVCDPTCQTCDITTINCTSCYNNLQLFQSSNNIGQCVCSPSQYNNSNICQNCDVNCHTCDQTSTNCTSCNNNLQLQANDNINHCICLTSQYLDISTGLCKSCDAACNGCTGPLSSNCILCSTGYILQQNSCISLCNTSQYYDSIDNICKNCSISCLTCTGSTPIDCLTCQNPLHLQTNSCITSCASNQYLDNLLNACITCNTLCLTCSGSTNVSCLSCANNSYLLQGTCYASCPTNYISNRSTHICDPIVPAIVHIGVTEIDNPYKFLLIFYSELDINVTIKKYSRQELILNATIKILDNRACSYQFTPSGINSSTFYLEMNYYNQSSINLTSEMIISFYEFRNPYLTLTNQTITLNLIKDHSCLSSEYYNSITLKCLQKIMIDFTWKYGDENNIIVFTFTNLNPRIISSILYENLFIITIPDFSPTIDYTYKLTSNTNEITLTLTYNKPVVGSVYLHLSLDPPLYQFLSAENQTIYITNRSYDIKLLQFYFLSQSDQATINNTAALTKTGGQTSTSAVYVSMFLSPGTSVAIRGMLLMNIVQLLKYIDINYPPNVIAIFRSDSNKLIFDQKIIDDEDSQVPATFQLYGISSSILNNLFDEAFQLSVLAGLSFLVALILFYSNIWSKFYMFEAVVLCLKSIIVWSMVVMMFIAKYLRGCLCVFLYIRYKKSIIVPWIDFQFALICSFYVIFFPLHIYHLIKKIQYFPEDEKTNQIYDMEFTKKTPSTTTSIHSNKITPINENIEKSKLIDSPKIKNITVNPKASTIMTIDTYFKKETYQGKRTSFLINLNKDPFMISDSMRPKKISEAPLSYGESLSPTQLITKKINIKRASVDWNSIEKLDNYDFKMSSSVIPSTTEKEREWGLTMNEPITALTLANKKKDYSVGSSMENSNNIGNMEKQVKSNDDITPFENPNNKGKNGRNWMIILMLITSFVRWIKGIYQPKDLKEFSYRYRILIKGVKKEEGINKFYFMVDLCRYFLLALIVSVLYDYPLTQICLMEVICLLFLIFLIIKRPFEIKIDMILCFINESLINSAFISAVVIGVFDKIEYMNSDIRMGFGWCIAFTYLILMYSLMVNTLQRMIRLMIYIIHRLIAKVRGKK